MTRSEKMAWYNKMRAAAKAGKPGLEIGRVNRALAIMNKGQDFSPYQTTLVTCTCEDSKRHPELICKHRLAKMAEFRVAEKNNPKPQQQPLAEKQVKLLKVTSYFLAPEKHLTDDGAILDRPMVMAETGWQYCSVDDILAWVGWEGWKAIDSKTIDSKSRRSGWEHTTVVTLEK